ncbi:MAG: hypothetical protein RIT32_216, partial [Actinomycetota bacterium]
MLLADLKKLAGKLNIEGASTMRKGELVAAIEAAQSTKSARGRDENSESDRSTQNREANSEGRDERREWRGRNDRNDRNDRNGDRRDNNRNRFDRNRNRRDRDGEFEIGEDDILVPAAGIVDILDNYAFVRTTGYLPGPNDVYVSLGLVKKYGLRKGDAITGQVKQPKDGESRQKFNPLVKVETVNGMDP